MHYDRRIIGYHGTSKTIAAGLLRGARFRQSNNDHDWLGSGIYVWEDGPDRALRWARKQHGRSAATVGVIVQLGNCFDLMDTRYTNDLQEGARMFHEHLAEIGAKPPENRGGARRLDCAVVNWWLTRLAVDGDEFQTVRRGFDEGPPIHPGMAITLESHVQIAVRDDACILGVFAPRVRPAVR